MKLVSSQLESHLAKTLASLYVISGDELLLKQDALQLIRETAKQAGFTERIRLTPETEEQLYPLLYTTSLMAEKRLIELDFQISAPNKSVGIILQEYAKRPVIQNILLVDISKVDAKITKSSWYQALEKNGIAIVIRPITRDTLPQWIMQRAKKYKLSISKEVAHSLADYAEGNLAAAAQAIEKIWLLRLEKPIDIHLIQAISINQSHFTIFDFVEKLIAGNTIRALDILSHLKSEGTEPSLILWAITRELRLLADMSQQLTIGITHENLWQKYNIFSRRQTAFYHFLKKCSAQDCWQYLKQAAHIDRCIKGATINSVWHALQIFCLRFNH
jgi:DNA polymerase-3 subunit delta